MFEVIAFLVAAVFIYGMVEFYIWGIREEQWLALAVATLVGPPIFLLVPILHGGTNVLGALKRLVFKDHEG